MSEPLKLTIKVNVVGSGYGNDWGFDITETMPNEVDPRDYIRGRMVEELNRHQPSFPTRFMPKQVGPGTAEGDEVPF